jgi:hypothetical protein
MDARQTDVGLQVKDLEPRSPYQETMVLAKQGRYHTKYQARVSELASKQASERVNELVHT